MMSLHRKPPTGEVNDIDHGDSAALQWESLGPAVHVDVLGFRQSQAPHANGADELAFPMELHYIGNWDI